MSKTYSVNEKDRDLIERFVSLSEGCPATIIGESYEISDRTIQGYRRKLENEGREGLPRYLEGKTRWVLRRFVADAEAGKLPASIAVRIDEKAGKAEPSKPAKKVPVEPLGPKGVHKMAEPEKAEPAFKEGDRVRYKGRGITKGLRGATGTVEKLDFGGMSALVVFDGRSSDGYWAAVVNLEPLPEAEDGGNEPESEAVKKGGPEKNEPEHAEGCPGYVPASTADKVHPTRPEGSAEAGKLPRRVPNPLHGADVHMLRRLTLIERSQRRTESLLNDILDILLAERKGR